MKKLIAILSAVVLAFGALISLDSLPASAAQTAPAAEAAEAPAPVIPEVRGLDYEALHALFPDDATAVTVAGKTADWGTLFRLLKADGLQVEDYFQQMAAYYQIAADWSGSAGNGLSFAQLVADQAKNEVMSMLLIDAFAEEKGIALTDEEREQLTPDALAAEVLGEGATASDLADALESRMHVTLADYVASAESAALFQKCFVELYGENGETLSEEEIVAALEAEDYLSANHILFMTIDRMTGEPLDEETVAEKKAKAAEISEELRGIEDTEALLKRFAELKEELCEDGGKVAYPDGYTFTPGTMVPEFEDAVRALGSYGVSEPVESTYGLHVIMRLPLSGDCVPYATQGTPTTAREALAAKQFTEEVDAFLNAHPAEYAEGIEDLDLTGFVKAES